MREALALVERVGESDIVIVRDCENEKLVLLLTVVLMVIDDDWSGVSDTD